jgi:predicted RNA binding protein YcfA (HicA-like mRNA interferase family)
MSRQLPVLRPRAVIRALERAGFVLLRVKGSHHYFEHPDRPELWSASRTIPATSSVLSCARSCARQTSPRRNFSICFEPSRTRDFQGGADATLRHNGETLYIEHRRRPSADTREVAQDVRSRKMELLRGGSRPYRQQGKAKGIRCEMLS